MRGLIALLALANATRAHADEPVEASGSYALEGFVGTGVQPVVAGLVLVEVAGDVGPRFRLVMLGIHGDGITSELGDVHGVSNNVAEPDVRPYEVWIEDDVGPAVVRAGSIAVDQQFVIAPHGDQLLAATFGVIGQVSANLVEPVYPVAHPGVSVRVSRATAAVYEDDLAFAELDLAPVKVGAWTHADRADGVYAVVDHAIGRGGVFARAGWSPGGPVTIYADAGARVGGVSAGVALSRVDGDHESLAELTYRHAIGAHLTVQPDLQLVRQPDRTTYVAGARVTASF